MAEGAAAPHFKTARTCKKLLKRSDALWTFLYIEGVEPTNDVAEFIADPCLALERSFLTRCPASITRCSWAMVA